MFAFLHDGVIGNEDNKFMNPAEVTLFIVPCVAHLYNCNSMQLVEHLAESHHLLNHYQPLRHSFYGRVCIKI
jgi:hypothetical protein